MIPTQDDNLMNLYDRYTQGEGGGGEPMLLAAAPTTAPVMRSATRPAAAPAVVTPAAPAATATTPANVPVTSTGQLDLVGLLSKYQPAGGSMYGNELTTARAKVTAESDAFNKLITDSMRGSQEEAPSKAEMYFRLASAFGAPTRTGTFTEAFSNVGKEAAAYAKEERESKRTQRALGLQLGLKAQEAKLSGARDELTTLRTLAGEEMKDKRAVSVELIKDYVKSGQPQSSAGKQAQDEGLQPGTEAFQKRVAAIAEADVDKKMAQINATLASMSVSQANLALSQARFENQKTQQAKLTPGEMKLKTETEDQVSSADAAMAALERAYRLNPNTFDSSAIDTAQRKVLEAAGSKDAKLLATREMENLLAQEALGKLRVTFGGNPTEGERKILLDLEGIGAKSIEERAQIMKNTFRILKEARVRHAKRLNEINAGLYRDTQPARSLEGE